ncbi:MAG: NAD+ synthase [Deltaproteobacteria bacterium]|nr:NAD+ synthase [Deltaproteobacteria bacterium]
MRVALCQLDPTVGDLEGNAGLILEAAQRASVEGADLAVFSELCLTGYPPKDLLDRHSFVRDQRARLDELAAQLPPELACLVGFVHESAPVLGRRLRNAAALCRGGRVEAVIAKRLLPTYDVFDEDRHFAPGEASEPIEVAGLRVGVTICEDIWNDVDAPIAQRRYPLDPVQELADAGVDLLVNLSASPFTSSKRLARPAMLAEVARRVARPVVFVNQVGGNDDLVFDGDSTLFGADGRTLARLSRFAPDLAVVELETGGVVREGPESDAAAALEALRLGVGDYATKCGFSGAVLGLSGGIDSALTAAIACRALGPEHVLGLALPTRYSSQHSLDDAHTLAANLGMRCRDVSIDAMFQASLDALTPELDALGAAGPGDVTFENIQARLRCVTLMAASNRLGLLLLTTGNKSELAVGYCTLYGDMAGGLAVISDLPKTFVYEVAREFNAQAGREIIPESTLTKPPSAELRPDQKDSDSLPDYATLDAILERHVEQHRTVEEIIADGFDEPMVRRIVGLVRGNEYKRRQMPPGLIVTKKAFGPGRRYPIAQGYRA